MQKKKIFIIGLLYALSSTSIFAAAGYYQKQPVPTTPAPAPPPNTPPPAPKSNTSVPVAPTPGSSTDDGMSNGQIAGLAVSTGAAAAGLVTAGILGSKLSKANKENKSLQDDKDLAIDEVNEKLAKLTESNANLKEEKQALLEEIDTRVPEDKQAEQENLEQNAKSKNKGAPKEGPDPTHHINSEELGFTHEEITKGVPKDVRQKFNNFVKMHDDNIKLFTEQQIPTVEEIRNKVEAHKKEGNDIKNLVKKNNNKKLPAKLDEKLQVMDKVHLEVANRAMVRAQEHAKTVHLSPREHIVG